MSQLLTYLHKTAKKFTIIHIHRRVPGLRFPLRCGHFGDSVTNKGYIAFFNAHAQTWLISTSGLKSDVTIVFLGPSFLYVAEIPAIRDHLRQKLA